MESRTCAGCGEPINLLRADAMACSARCRKRVSRRPRIPVELTSRARWVRRSALKRPLTVAGKAASSTDARTWATYSEAHSSSAGVGLGFVLNGDGVACVDLDGVLVDGALDPRAADLLASLDSFYVEVSPSGRGVHAWVYGGSPDGRKVFKLANGLKVEWYSDGRYITVTGKAFEV